ncbi:MAG: peptide deformylase [Legionellales bacterium]|nr:peptide deformylase [Legionellales bacterium]|tara:strand:+ start:188 stop:691 length:504 start_codon:yes stop_codon:yes gene_type:complete
MALLPILKFPDPRLRHKAVPVAVVNDEIKTIIADMLETMYEDNGIGLAAIQVNIQKQIIVMDISDDKNDPKVIINPEIIDAKGNELMSEGCLSVPGIYAEVPRAQEIQVKCLDREGNSQEFSADGLLGHCIQHEMDHLQGKLFIDYLSPLKRERIRKKLEKVRKQNF